ncbi:MAG: hypothetical protein ACK4PR_01685, partial [Gammaproteobacteria bacterium]
NKLHDDLISLQEQYPDKQSDAFKKLIAEKITLIKKIKDNDYTMPADDPDIKQFQKNYENYLAGIQKDMESFIDKIPQILYSTLNDDNIPIYIEDFHNYQLSKLLLDTIDALKQLRKTDSQANLALRTAYSKLFQAEQVMQYRRNRYEHNQSFTPLFEKRNELTQRLQAESLKAENIEQASKKTIILEINQLYDDMNKTDLPFVAPRFTNDIPYVVNKNSSPGIKPQPDFINQDLCQTNWATLLEKIELIKKHPLNPLEKKGIETIKNDIEIKIKNSSISILNAVSINEKQIQTAKNILTPLANTLTHQIEKTKKHGWMDNVIGDKKAIKFEREMLGNIAFALGLARYTFTSVSRNPELPTDTVKSLLEKQLREVVLQIELIKSYVNEYKNHKDEIPDSCKNLSRLLERLIQKINPAIESEFPANNHKRSDNALGKKSN